MSTQVAPKPTVALPDEKFWQRYSPRSELPLSSIASVSLHLLTLLVLLAGGVFLVQSQDNTKPIPSSAVEIGDGSEDGKGIEPNEAFHSPKSEAIRPNPLRSQDRPIRMNQEDPLQPPTPAAKDPIPRFEDPGREIFEEAKKAEASRSDIIKRIQTDLTESTGPRGPVEGTKPPGQDRAKLNADREVRRDRWVLNIETRDGGNDYARQLHALGAILAIPQPDGQYLIVRDLTKRPARGQIEDIGGIQRIFWVDNKPESVRSLVTALQLDRVPPWFVAFFPKDLEDDLLRKELAFKNRREADIRKTYFRLVRKGTGYDPVVVAQEPRAGVE
jgi:hypothetical protein